MAMMIPSSRRWIVQSRKSDILRLAEPDFIKWLRAGLLQIPRSSSIPPNETDVLVQVPVKYGRLVDKGQTFVALIDEIVGVSKLTPDLTREFSARLRNLGEAWLPISYHPEWLSELVKTTNMPVEPAGENAVPPPDSYGEAAAIEQKGTLDLSDTTEERVKSGGVSAPKGRKRSSVAQTGKRGTTAGRAKEAQSSLLPGPNGDAGDRQSEDAT